MANRRNAAASGLNPMGWMVTFSDLVNLLLTFFVLLVAMSTMDVASLQQMAGPFVSGGGGPLEAPQDERARELARLLEGIERAPAESAAGVEELKTVLFKFEDAEFSKMMALPDREIEVSSDARGLVIQVSDSILFREGGSDLKPEFLPVLSRIAELLRVSRRPVSIEGHTDDSPLEGAGRTWAWDLSFQRAKAVLDYFTLDEALAQERFRVGGFGATRPLVPNNSRENRAKNRRIEIILYREAFS
ncbi:MAG: flagellar motor protein MotB [Thermodesulfobacteriota bacterium]